MGTDASLPVRRGVLTLLKGVEALTDLVPAASIYPQSPRVTPQWPFVKYGGPTAIPLRASCVDGCEVTVALHSFSKGRWADDVLLETAEDHAARIGAGVVSALDGRRLDLGSGFTAKARWTGGQLLPDGAEEDAYHHVANFRVRVLA